MMNTTLELKIMLHTNKIGARSIHDAQIIQKVYNFIIETKKDARNFELEQLKRHLNYLEPKENNVLLTLSRQGMDYELKTKMSQLVKKLEIKHVDFTFGRLISIIRNIIPKYLQFHEILNDFEEFCLGCQMLNNCKNNLYAFVATNTLEDDLKYNAYWYPAKNY